MKRTIESYSHLRAEAYVINSRGLDSTSKAHKFLGGGKGITESQVFLILE